ncbi:MAG: hypothetical protein AAF996_06820 [Pseudomonadota bacterium]
MTGDRRLTLWLTPSAADAIRFQAIINHLAQLQGAPCFTPHMTLASFDGQVPDIAPALEVLKDLQLTPAGIGRTDVFTQSLFLRVEGNDALLKARAYFQSCPGFRAGRVFDPHLSLCYGAPPSGAADLPAVKALLDEPIHFDGLKRVELQLPVDSYDAIRAWKEGPSSSF